MFIIVIILCHSYYMSMIIILLLLSMMQRQTPSLRAGCDNFVSCRTHIVLVTIRRLINSNVHISQCFYKCQCLSVMFCIAQSQPYYMNLCTAMSNAAPHSFTLSSPPHGTIL